MDQIIIKKPAFKIAGYGIKTNIINGRYTKDVVAFWSKYNINGVSEHIHSLLAHYNKKYSKRLGSTNSSVCYAYNCRHNKWRIQWVIPT